MLTNILRDLSCKVWVDDVLHVAETEEALLALPDEFRGCLESVGLVVAAHKSIFFARERQLQHNHLYTQRGQRVCSLRLAAICANLSDHVKRVEGHLSNTSSCSSIALGMSNERKGSQNKKAQENTKWPPP